MKRLAFSLLVIFFTSPFFALAQDTAASRYCPNPETDFFKGSIYYENDKPWIEVKVDPEFEKNELRTKRHITGDIPLTPVYDLVVQIKPEFNYYCVPGWVEGQPVTADKLPGEVSIDGFLTVGSGDEAIVGPGVFVRTEEKDEQERFIYEWKLKGWTNGIAPAEKMERLVDVISRNEPVTVSLLITKDTADGKDFAHEKSPVSFNLCAPIWGSGRHAIAYARMATNYGLSQFISDTESVRTDGFEKIDPFRQAQYKTTFSHHADLRLTDPIPFNASFFTLTNHPYGIRYTLRRHNKFFETLSSVGSSCSGSVTVVLGETQAPGVAALRGKALFVHKNVGKNPDIASVKATLPIVVLHEFGHAFAGLNDEYEYGGPERERRMALPFRNCSTVPETAWHYQGVRYGDTKWQGCSFSSVFRGGKASEPVATPVYRPSEKSMMKAAQTGEFRFNVVSCGYIIKAIKGGRAEEYWQECMGYDTVKPTGVAFRSFMRFFSVLMNGIANERLTAQVSASIEGPQTPDHILLESWDPNDPWGEIIEIVTDSQGTPPAPTTQPPTPSTDNLGVNSESIFDTVFLDLKVNGKDGPVTIKAGSRIVVSWISEGTTRCRANWSRNDIKLSGTAAGRLSRSVTIRAACINAERERVDDAVQVLVDTESS